MAQIVSLADVSSQKKTALINKYARLQSEMAALKTELELCKVEAIDLLGEGLHTTTSVQVSVKWTERPVLDQAKAKSFLTAGQMADCIKTSSFYDVRVKHL
jgi:hypothetical protein